MKNLKPLTQKIVDSVLEGQNGIILSYGQPASGKTYTMMGGGERHTDQGLISSALSYIFNKINKRKDKKYKVILLMMG